MLFIPLHPITGAREELIGAFANLRSGGQMGRVDVIRAAGEEEWLRKPFMPD